MNRLQIKASSFSGKNLLVIVDLQEALKVINHCLALIDSVSDVFNWLHVAPTIKAFLSQLEERLLTASSTLVSQMRGQDRAITKEVHATTLAPRILFIETLLHEIRQTLDLNCAAPPSTNGSHGPDRLSGPWGPPVISTSSPGDITNLSLLDDIENLARFTCRYLEISTEGLPLNPL